MPNKKQTLPRLERFYDYHEIEEVEEHIHFVDTSVKVKECGFDGDYIAIIYRGRLTDPKNTKLVAKATEISRKFDNED